MGHVQMLEATLSKAKEHQARIELQHQEEVVRLRRGIEEGQAAAKEARDQAEAHEAAEALARERLKVREGRERLKVREGEDKHLIGIY